MSLLSFELYTVGPREALLKLKSFNLYDYVYSVNVKRLQIKVILI